MHIKTLVVALVGVSAAVEGAEIGRRSPFSQALERRQRGGNGNGGGNRGGGNNGGNNNGGNNNNNGGNNALVLSANAQQEGSESDGNNPGTNGQAASDT